MAFPRLVDLLVAPLRALARAQGALSRAVLVWLRGRFDTDDAGVAAPKMIGVSEPEGGRAIAVPVAALLPPPGLEVGEATVSFDLEIVQSLRPSPGATTPIAFTARPIATRGRRRASQAASIRMEVTVRSVRPGPALQRIEERLSDPSGWRIGAGEAAMVRRG